MSFRFVHAADIHLDSPLRSLALRDPELAELIGNATRRAFVNIIDLCLAEQVDALLLAGDLYDGEQTSMKTARFLADQLRQLHEAGIKVFIIRGNHDALSRITKELTFPESVTLFGGRADSVEVARPNNDRPVFVHGLSFARPHAPESLLKRYKPPVPEAINIGIMHTSLGGTADHDDYAPCPVSDLDAHGFDYWALGHIHKRSEYKGRARIVMPGMPQGRDINESGAKSVTLVTIGDDRSVHQLEERPTCVAQFESLPVALTGIADWRDAISALNDRLIAMRENVPAEHLVVRPRFTGTTPLAWRLRRDRDLLHTEAASRAFLAGKCWIDKIEIDCRAPGATLAPTADPVTELRRFINEDLIGSAAYQAEVAAIADDLLAQMPPDCRSILGSDEAGFRSRLNELISEGSEDVLARLHAGAAPEAA
jgi:DNA repair exonuclease SbcCD nuclease subunit